MSAFDSYFHPDHSIPSDFKEAFPAGRFRSVCKIQAKRGASSSVNVETISPPEWWQSTKVVQAFNEVLQARVSEVLCLIVLGMRLTMHGVARIG